MRVRRMLPVALLVLAPVLTGCGDDGDDAADDPTTSAAPTESASESTSAPVETSDAPSPTAPTSDASSAPAPVTLPAACEVVSSDDIAAAYHVPFTAGDPGQGTTTQQGVEWRSDNCDFEAADLVEVEVSLTGADDFTAGKFRCPQPSDMAAIVEPVDDIAGAAKGWWKTSDSPPLEASLRACTSDVLVEIELEYEDGVDYEGDPRNDSIALAEKILAQL